MRILIADDHALFRDSLSGRVAVARAHGEAEVIASGMSEEPPPLGM
jgi:hypothetical protein